MFSCTGTVIACTVCRVRQAFNCADFGRLACLVCVCPHHKETFDAFVLEFHSRTQATHRHTLAPSCSGMRWFGVIAEKGAASFRMAKQVYLTVLRCEAM